MPVIEHGCMNCGSTVRRDSETGNRLPPPETEELRRVLRRIAVYGDSDPDFLQRNAYVILAEVVMAARGALDAR